VLPLMLYHQLQLMVCAALAQRLGRGAAPEDPRPARGEPARAAS
jgi:sodium/bile acid cotransporter 7